MSLNHQIIGNLKTWFTQKGKTYPWSLTKNPYHIWISEVMLQQTVVKAIFNHYQRWLDQWPNIVSLAQAQESAVLRAWEGLGYYQRGRNLHKAAQLIVKNGHQTLPDDEAFLRTLPGMGSYTRAAVLSFAYNRPLLALDANLKRIFQRLNGEKEWSSRLEAKMNDAFLSPEGFFRSFSSRELNAAFMQLGQIVCIPRSPECHSCPLTHACTAHQSKIQHLIPTRKIKTVSEKTTLVGLYIKKNDLDNPLNWEIFLARPLKGRFSHLWLFPISQEEGIPLSSRIHYYTRYRDQLKPQMLFSSHPILPEGWTGFWITFAQAESLGMPSVYRQIYREALAKLATKDILQN